MLRPTAVITGANTGVGRATAEALACDHDLVLLCRDESRAQPVLAALGEVGCRARLIVMDLSSLRSVREAVRALEGREIELLINNAGVGGVRGLTEDGFELAFGTNYLGHYLLTRSLVAQLTPTARVIHLGSGSHARVRGVDLGAVQRSTRSLTGVDEYGVSKLAQMLFHRALARRLQGPRSLVADPGDVASEAYRHLPCPLRQLWTRNMKSPAAGALTTLHCASAPDVVNGGAYVDGCPFSLAARALDDAAAERLWAQSAAWVGLSS